MDRTGRADTMCLDRVFLCMHNACEEVVCHYALSTALMSHCLTGAGVLVTRKNSCCVEVQQMEYVDRSFLRGFFLISRRVLILDMSGNQPPSVRCISISQPSETEIQFGGIKTQGQVPSPRFKLTTTIEY